MLSRSEASRRQHDRPFAAAQGDTVRHLRLMPIGLGDASVPTLLNTTPAPTRHETVVPVFGGTLL